jgi:hypothetical protein
MLLPFGTHDVKVIGVVLTPLGLWLLFKNYRNHQKQLLIICFLVITVFSILGSLRMAGSMRYSYVPTIILYLILISEISAYSKGMHKRAFVVLGGYTMICLTLHVLFYQKRQGTTYYSYYPKWKEEVKLWREDKNHLIKIHPYSEAEPWYIDLRSLEKK